MPGKDKEIVAEAIKKVEETMAEAVRMSVALKQQQTKLREALKSLNTSLEPVFSGVGLEVECGPWRITDVFAQGRGHVWGIMLNTGCRPIEETKLIQLMDFVEGEGVDLFQAYYEALQERAPAIKADIKTATRWKKAVEAVLKEG